MNYIVIFLLIIVIGLLLIILYQKNTNNINTSNKNPEELVKYNDYTVTTNMGKNKLKGIQVEIVNPGEFKNVKDLVEIKNEKTLAYINNAIPTFAKAGLNINKAINLHKQENEVLYKAILPVGEELSKSKKTEGLFRGMYHSKKGIKGHAEFEKKVFDNKIEIRTNISSAIMNIASMVVGQYYMSEIHKELGRIDKRISYVTDFLDKQYQSKVIAMITNTRSIADFTMDIMENNEERNRKLESIENMIINCSELLGQANLSLKSVKDKTNLNLNEYEKEMKEVQKWFVYQMMITETMINLTELKYVLNFGRISIEQCSSTLSMYLKDNDETRKCLNVWHHDNMRNLEIDEHDWTIKRNGLDGVLHFVPGMISRDLKYKELDPYIVNLIKVQTNKTNSIQTIDKRDLYNKDVELICKNGKVYYLPSK